MVVVIISKCIMGEESLRTRALGPSMRRFYKYIRDARIFISQSMLHYGNAGILINDDG